MRRANSPTKWESAIARWTKASPSALAGIAASIPTSNAAAMWTGTTGARPGRLHEAGPTLTLAMVALEADELPEETALLSWFKKRAKRLPVPTAVVRENDTIAANLGDATLANGAHAKPDPLVPARGAVRDRLLVVRGRERDEEPPVDLMITVAGGDIDTIDRNLWLTWLVSAVLGTTSSSAGVYWGAGTLVLPPDLFISTAKKMTREQLPLDLWIDFRVYREEDGTVSAFTTGLHAFGHLEIEVSHSKKRPTEVRNRVWNTAHYLLDNGQTIGLSAKEKIGIKHLPSIWDSAKTVIRLEM